MPSFDIVSKVDPQTLDNAMNTVKREIQNRYDFRDTKGSIEYDKKANELAIAFVNNFKQFEAYASEEMLAAFPKVAENAH